MNLSEFVDGGHGRQTLLARALGCPSQLVWQWARDARPLPTERAPSIERETGGQVTCEEMLPGVRWHRVPDAAWPWHPQGRPLIDVARPAPTCAAIQPPCGVADTEEAGHAG